MCIGHHHQDDAELSSPSPAKLSKTENGARHDSNHIPCSLEIHSPNSSPSVVTVRALAIHHKNTRDTTGEEGKGLLVLVACIDCLQFFSLEISDKIGFNYKHVGNSANTVTIIRQREESEPPNP